VLNVPGLDTDACRNNLDVARSGVGVLKTVKKKEGVFKYGAFGWLGGGPSGKRRELASEKIKKEKRQKKPKVGLVRRQRWT